MILISLCWMAIFCINGCLSTAISRLHFGYDFRSEILNLHNYIRRNYAKGISGIQVANMQKLRWNEELEITAQLSVQMPSSESHLFFEATVNRNATGNYILDIMKWYHDITADAFDGRCLSSFSGCISGLMMLNAEHTDIGCAYGPSQDSSSYTFICIYRGGVFDPENGVFKNGSVCSNCATNSPFCEDGLCVQCDHSTGACDCRRDSCSSPVGVGTLNTTTCLCQCEYGQGPNCDVPCQNAQDNFYDYDICETIPLEACHNRDDEEQFMLLREFCPHRCSVCRELPTF